MLYISMIFKNVANAEVFFLYIIFLKFHLKFFIQLQKTWPFILHPNRRILSIFTISHLKFFITNFRLNLVKNNDVTLS